MTLSTIIETTIAIALFFVRLIYRLGVFIIFGIFLYFCMKPIVGYLFREYKRLSSKKKEK